MSIIRLSVLKDGVYAPDHRGTIDPDTSGFRAGSGKDRRGIGNMGLHSRPTLNAPDDALTRYLIRSLEIEAARLPADQPVVVMVHGWQFDPAVQVVRPPHHHKADNPHARLYHFEDHGQTTEMRHHSTSWPIGLGFGEEDQGEKGLCVAFGWNSAPGFFSSLFDHGLNPYARAYEFAETVAWQLANVVEILTRTLDRRIDIFCHSLGSRAVVRSLAQIADGDALASESGDRLRTTLGRIDRVIILAGAEKVLEGQLMMTRLNEWARPAAMASAQAAGRDDPLFEDWPQMPHFYNVVSRENDVLDKLGENFGPAAPGSKQVIGHNGLERRDPHWVDIQLDDPHVALWFKTKNYKVSGDNTSSIFAVLDHWIHYTWKDNMRVYHDILRDRFAGGDAPDMWRIDQMKAVSLAVPGHIFDRVRLIRGHVPHQIL